MASALLGGERLQVGFERAELQTAAPIYLSNLAHSSVPTHNSSCVSSKEKHHPPCISDNRDHRMPGRLAGCVRSSCRHPESCPAESSTGPLPLSRVLPIVVTRFHRQRNRLSRASPCGFRKWRSRRTYRRLRQISIEGRTPRSDQRAISQFASGGARYLAS